MIRHLKMELKRRQECEYLSAPLTSQPQQQPQQQTSTEEPLTNAARLHQQQAAQQSEQKLTARRARGRRSSKPAMEKRRRARINECLDILKSYVLNDPANLAKLGIDANSRENQDEESIARLILNSSGLINRHRGRKNPNKLEKADILELTVDYVVRLHAQRAQTLLQLAPPPTEQQTWTISAPMSKPLTLNLSGGGHLVGLQATSSTPPSPPPSSASCSPQPLLSVCKNIISPSFTADVLDLSVNLCNNLGRST